MEGVGEERGAALLGIVNVTPNSFYDGGQYFEPNAAHARVDELLEQGADLLDIGAESTRPGAPSVPAEEQWRRTAPVLEYAVRRGARVSIDTTSAEVAERALDAGARIVNDVSCLTDRRLARVVAERSATLLLMHSRGSMTPVAGFSSYPEHGYGDVVAEVRAEWETARDAALEEGVAPENVWFDPGLGFHKNAAQSAELLRRFSEFASLGALLTIGASRKSFIGALDDSSPGDRLPGSLIAALCAVDSGAKLLRVHDVRAHRQALLARAAFRRRPAATALEEAPR